MNKLKAAHALCKAKARQLCFLVLLCFHLASGDVPGPCKHSVTNDHIQIVNTLIVNQLENGCSIEYKFIDQGSLSKTCYVKAAFPKVLDVLTKHFNYHKSSVNFKYVDELKTLVKNIYRTKCILEVNVSMEDDPEKFVKAYAGSPAAVLGHIRKVMSFYMELLTENSRPINWSCADQYAQDVAELTTEGTLPTGYGSKILGHGEGEIQPSDGPRGGRQSEKESQYETQNPYKQLFISAAVCGGLLGICAIYCFIQKKELQARLHKQEQDEKLKQHSHCLEMEESTLLKRQSGSAL
ncbi:macrophage colony-stimulating factor 1-like isoform X5 [Polyodon spathula]|uniref:macrophage colony-stimulating factor 1-like isoform X5 n=1 Tax=Polyodon spathula TaxID=7913 RepID=UPI001B7EA19D|nr:macrophage colony-stimulating factor 1-like isoform X5 [Polyodon spathula]